MVFSIFPSFCFSHCSPVEENYFFKRKLKVLLEKTLHHFVIVVYHINFGFCLNTISYYDYYAKYINSTKYFIGFSSYLFVKLIPFPHVYFFFYESLWTISYFSFVHMNICLFCTQSVIKKIKKISLTIVPQHFEDPSQLSSEIYYYQFEFPLRCSVDSLC